MTYLDNVFSNSRDRFKAITDDIWKMYSQIQERDSGQSQMTYFDNVISNSRDRLIM